MKTGTLLIVISILAAIVHQMINEVTYNFINIALLWIILSSAITGGILITKSIK